MLIELNNLDQVPSSEAMNSPFDIDFIELLYEVDLSNPLMGLEKN